MERVVLGRTGLRVARLGLGSGGPSRLGLAKGRSRSESVALVREALDRGVDLLDSSERYGTEEILGEALRGHARETVVLCTKGPASRGTEPVSPDALERAVEASLRRLGIDHVDVYLLHGVLPEHYDHALAHLRPRLEALRERGWLRFVGLSEAYARDPRHRMLARAVLDDAWDVVLVGYHLLDATARRFVLPRAAERGVGVLGAFAVSERLATAEAARDAVRELAQQGRLTSEGLDPDEPLGFLTVPGGACSRIAAAYRFALSEPDLHVVLTGTSDRAHLCENLAAAEEGPLPGDLVDRVRALSLPATSAAARTATAPPARWYLGRGRGEATLARRFHLRGYAHLPRVLPEALLAELRAECERLARWEPLLHADNLRSESRRGPRGETVLSKFDPVADVSAPFDELARDRRILEPVRRVLGEEPVRLKDKLVFKPPGHPGFDRHRDRDLWLPFSERAVTVAIAIDAAPVASGPLEVEPGGHRRDPEGARRDGRARRMRPIPLQAGDLLLFDCRLPHRSGPNGSAEPRRQLLLTYSPASSGDRYSAYYRHYRDAKLSAGGETVRRRAFLDPAVLALDEPERPSVATAVERPVRLPASDDRAGPAVLAQRTLSATVLIPTHDHGATLAHAVRGALDQTVRDLEVLVIGDGIPPAARPLVEEAAAADPRVRLFDLPKHPRRGEPYRHRVLAEEARGRAVFMLCDRDLWLPDHVERLLGALAEADFVHSLPLHVLPGGELRVFPVDLGLDFYRDVLLGGDNRVPLSCAAHTMAFYDRLPHGWRDTPSGVPTDLYMFQQMLAVPGVRAASTEAPTAITFPSPPRKGWTRSQRLEELEAWRERLADARGRAAFEAAAVEAAFRARDADRAAAEEAWGRRLEAERARAEALRQDLAAMKSTLTWRLRHTAPARAAAAVLRRARRAGARARGRPRAPPAPEAPRRDRRAPAHPSPLPSRCRAPGRSSDIRAPPRAASTRSRRTRGARPPGSRSRARRRAG